MNRPLLSKLNVRRHRILRAAIEPLEQRRLLSGGAIDTTFGTQGQGLASLESATYVAATLIAPDGGIFVVGSSSDDSGAIDFTVARFSSDGTPDATFGSDGVVTTNFNGGDDEAYCAAVQADGKLVVGGYGDGAAVLVRYNTDGSLDPTFGSGGEVTLAAGTEVDGLAILRNGDILASGASSTGVYLARLNTDGSIDSAFGDGGVANIADTSLDDGGGLHVLASGNILLIGNETAQLATQLSYFKADGALISTIDPANSGVDNLSATAVQADGKVIVADFYDGFLQRFNADGSVDATFGSNGTVMADLTQISGLTVAPDGDILIAGSLGSQAGIERFNPDGSVDMTFGADGEMAIPQSIWGGGIAIQRDGGILGSAQNIVNDGETFSLTRFSPTADVTAATATASASDVTARGQGDVLISVTYSSASGIDETTLADGNVSVTDASGNNLNVSYQSATDNPDGTMTATYDVQLMSGKNFTYRDNGAYTITLNGGSVIDNDSAPVPQTALGTFNVNIAPPPAGTPAPSAAMQASTLTTPASIQETVTIIYTGHDGIDDSTLGFVNVNGPSDVWASQVSQTANADGSVSVVYAITKDDGTQFTPADDGKYEVSLDPGNPVMDNDGTPISITDVGAFSVNVTPPPAGAVAPTAGNLVVTQGDSDSERVISVTYTGTVPIAQQTLDSSDLTIRGDNGASVSAVYQSATTHPDGSVTATYTANFSNLAFVGPIVANGSTVLQAKPADASAGTQNYTLSVNAGQVSDVQGSTVAATTLGTFEAPVLQRYYGPLPLANSVLGARSSHPRTTSSHHHHRHHHHHHHHSAASTTAMVKTGWVK